MGMPDAFDPAEADFSGMAERIPGMNLYITGVFHKAFVAVDEEGTEAAAATAVVAGIESAAPIRETEAFTADLLVYRHADGRTLTLSLPETPPYAYLPGSVGSSSA